MIFMVVILPWINIMSINPRHKYKTTKQVHNFNLQLYKRKKVTLLVTNNNILHFIRVACSIYQEENGLAFIHVTERKKEILLTF